MLEIIIIIAVVALDQLTKVLCASWLPTLADKSFPLIEGVFSLSYVENRGAAFGMLQDKQIFFIVITLVICGLIAYVMIKDRRRMHTLMRVTLALVLAGAIGNFIDRVFLGYVRDMFYFELIDFAVFNVADAAITVGAATLVLDILFFKGRKFFEDKPRESATDGAKASDADAEGDKTGK